jgi:hypothetical protein
MGSLRRRGGPGLHAAPANTPERLSFRLKGLRPPAQAFPSISRIEAGNGTEINPDLIAKLSLCVSCRKAGDPNEEIPCTLTRADQQGEEEFECFAFEPKS